MKTLRRATFYIVAILAISACQSLGLAPADSLDSKIAYAYGTHTAVLQTAAALRTEGAISNDDAKSVLQLADQSRQLLDSARVIEKTDSASAGNNLALATAVLTQIQTFLNAKRSHTP